MAYPINWSNVSTMQGFLATPNTSTGGYFWVAILYMLVFVALLALMNFGWEAAVLSALFFGILIGTIMVYMGLVSMIYVGILVGLEIFLFIYIMYSANRQQI